MIAPAAIPIAAPPDRELLPDVAVFATVGTAGAAVVVGVDGPPGSDGENGLLPPPPGVTGTAVEPVEAVGAVEAASAATGNAHTSVSAPTTSHTRARDFTPKRTLARYRSDASGCSIAGVSGALRYGSSFS